MSTANSIAYICEYFVKNSHKNSYSAVECYSDDFIGILEDVLDVIVFEDSNFMWSLSKPLINLILLCKNRYCDCVKNIVAKINNNEMQNEIWMLLIKLSEGINSKIDDKSREQFSCNFTELKSQLTKYVDSGIYYSHQIRLLPINNDSFLI